MGQTDHRPSTHTLLSQSSRMLSLHTLPLSNTAEVSTTNIRSGAAFDNVKASWNQALKLGDFSTQLTADYDYNANKDFINEVTLTANTQGTTLAAEYDQADGLKEVSAERDVEIADQNVNVQPSWIVKSKTARVKLMSKLNGGDGLSVQVDHNTDGGDTTYEVGYDHNLEDGRDISATIKPGDKTIEVDYVDTKFESGATWTATASAPLEGSNILDAAKLSLKRSWSW